MRIGQLCHRITLQSKTETQDEFGGISSTWADVAPVWASVNPLSGRQLELARAVHNEISHEITLRYRAGVSPAMRVRFGSRVFDIHSVINYGERNVELKLMCVELVL